MLILSRRVGETVHIGDHISLTVMHISGNKIRLGIETRTEVPILRGELRPRQGPQLIEFNVPLVTDEPKRHVG